ncbi:hypothetical protein M9458_018787, partial [Cirrhinus mrigala]
RQDERTTRQHHQCYAPTNDGDDEAKDVFYEQLQSELETAPRHDLIVIMGDLNAKVGSNNTHHDRAMGSHGCGVMNDNGERLVEFCTLNNMVIGGTLFPHRDIHKLTRCSPNGRDKNQIDHLMINGTWRRSLLDVKVKRGADVGSDHHLVTALIRLKLQSTDRKTTMRKHFDVSRLRDTKVKAVFVVQVRNRFQALQALDEEAGRADETNKQWEQVASLYSKSIEACVGYKWKKKKEWLTENTWKAIDERRNLKKKLTEAKSGRLQERYLQQYREANKTVKRMVRADKRAFMDNLATQAEDAADRGEQGTLFRITKALSGKHHGSASAPPIKDKKGRLLTTEKEQEARWAEHFQEVSTDRRLKKKLTYRMPVLTLISTLTRLGRKKSKAPGYDNLNAELFKADPDLAATILQPLFRTIWERKQVPDDWNKGIIVKIPKKGALSDCNNWRGITLLSVPSKILAKVIIQRIYDAVDKSLRNEQAGFRRGRGCIDQIFALRNIIEQCTEWQRQLYINFVDFEKAFDSIHRDSLWRILRAYGIPDQIVELIKSFYTNFSCSVGNSDVRFEVKTGVRQGCVMSALLFNLVIDWVMRRTTEDGARGIRWTLFSSLEDLDFADDLALLSHTHQHMQEKTNRLNTFARQVGLKISQRKTEVMILNIDSPAPVKVDGKELPTTKSFTYLGSIVRQDGGAGNDIQSRLNKARTVFMTLNNVWRSSQYSVHTKLRIYQSCVLSALLYGSECWRMTEGDLNKLSTFHTTSLRKILRIFWPRKISNHDLLQRCKQEDMDTIITRRRWRWIGHVMRKDCTSISKTALHWTPEGKRKRGRPKNTWRRTVEAELKTLNHTWGTIEKLAKDRQNWMIFVAALHASRRNRLN